MFAFSKVAATEENQDFSHSFPFLIIAYTPCAEFFGHILVILNPLREQQFICSSSRELEIIEPRISIAFDVSSMDSSDFRTGLQTCCWPAALPRPAAPGTRRPEKSLYAFEEYGVRD